MVNDQVNKMIEAEKQARWREEQKKQKLYETML